MGQFSEVTIWSASPTRGTIPTHHSLDWKKWSCMTHLRLLHLGVLLVALFPEAPHPKSFISTLSPCLPSSSLPPPGSWGWGLGQV